MANVEAEHHVITYPFGRYGVIFGHKISTLPLTLGQARRLAAGADEEVGRELMAEESATLRAKRLQLVDLRKKLHVEIEDLKLTVGKVAAHQLRLRQAALQKCERGLEAVLEKETKLNASGRINSAAPAAAQVDDEAEDAITELERLTRHCDEFGASSKDASRVVYLISRLRFLGLVGQSSEATILLVDRMMQLRLSPAAKRLRWATFAQWPRRRPALALA